MSSIFQLPVEIQKEFSIDNEGKASASQRGTARLAGVSQPAIRKLLLKLSDNLDVPEIFKSYAGYTFEGDNLPDVLVALIIEYYGFEAGRYCTEQAKLVFRSFASMGFRVWAQKQLGWQKQQKKLSLEEIAFFANFASEAAQNAGVSKAVAESLKLDSVRQFAPAAEPLLSQMKNKIYVEIKYFEPEKTKYKEAPRRIDSLYNHPNRFRYTHGYGYGDIDSKCQISRMGDTDCYFEFINGECNQFLGEYKANIIKEISREEATGIDRFEAT